VKSRVASDRLRGAALRQRAVELRIAGQSYASIGSAIGCSRQNAFAHVSKAFDEIRAETEKDAAALRAVEIERLDALLRAVWEAAMTGDFGAVDRALKIAERRARLCGLDMPALHAATDSKGDDLDLATLAAAARDARAERLDADELRTLAALAVKVSQ